MINRVHLAIVGHNIGDVGEKYPKNRNSMLIDKTMDDKERNHIETFDCFGDQRMLGLQWKH